MAKCGMKTEVYARVCGYCRPVSLWNKGKQNEFRDRKMYDPNKNSKPKNEKPTVVVTMGSFIPEAEAQTA